MGRWSRRRDPGGADGGADGDWNPTPVSSQHEAPSAPGDAFDDELAALGFTPSGRTRWGGQVSTLAFNRHLRFVLHEFDDAVLLSWSFAFGEYAQERGWQLGVSDMSTAELYPGVDVRLPRDVEAVGGEITRILTTLRLDLGDPAL